MSYVYRHIRLDKNEPFYIGIGSDEEGEYTRAYTHKSRNIHWHRIVNKTDYEVEILLNDLTWEESCIKEIEFIKLYGRKDRGLGPLCNLTDGGESSLGRITSEETKKKISESTKGRPVKPISEETKRKIADSKRGKKRPPISEETREKIRQNGFKRKNSQETRLKISQGNKGKKGKIGGDNPKAITLLDIYTGVFYETVKEISELYDMSYQTVMRSIRGESKINKFPNLTIV